MSSLDDAIDFANSRLVFSEGNPYLERTEMSAADAMFSHGILLASYIFAAPDHARYIGQFINSHISCVNGIPVQLLSEFEFAIPPQPL